MTKEINYFRNPMRPDEVGLGNMMDKILEDREIRKEEIIDNLTDDETSLFTTEHSKHYTGTDDNMPEAFELWLEDLSTYELEKILNK